MKGDEFFTRAATRAPFSSLHPTLGAFFRDYLAGEKIAEFRGLHVVNTQFPPWPSPAFDNLARHFEKVGCAEERRLYSVTLAVTNRCDYRCWHCYNAGRCQDDMPLRVLKAAASSLQDMGAVMVTLTGGEPLLRKDLERIAASFDSRSCLTLNTTGDGLTRRRASRLKGAGLFGVGVSLDSRFAYEHDRLRGRRGAFDTALRAVRISRNAGLYPYVISVATREFIEPGRFMRFMRFAGEIGALEVHLLEPSLTGRLAGRTDLALGAEDRELIIGHQTAVARRPDLPILSTFTYLESPNAFGCGAGVTYLYIDGSGAVCPCNVVPVSFGNISLEPLEIILRRMSRHFKFPRTECVGRTLSCKLPAGEPLPTRPKVTEVLCRRHISRSHPLPRFFRLRLQAAGKAGASELKRAYDRIAGDYDEFWARNAVRPVEVLVNRLSLRGNERVFEAGCGTGAATALIAGRLGLGGGILAADISAGMIAVAKKRMSGMRGADVRFRVGDALALLARQSGLDLVFSSWVLGYIRMKPFLSAAVRALSAGGRVAFVVHRDQSPAEPLEIFGGLVAEDPSVLMRPVSFDFPRDARQLRGDVAGAGLDIEHVGQGRVTFRCDTGEEVLRHLVKSGAGTVFYDAIDPARRSVLERRFVEMVTARRGGRKGFVVAHDYLVCVARKGRF
jgi:MoaA/NifB/PqqE/SkfB family radical SAM enzyme/SAM-dependent methyltransferase